MPSGKFASSTLPANADTQLHEVPANTINTVNIRLCNRTSNAIRVHIAIGTGATPTDADYIAYNATVPPNGILEETGIACSAGEKIWINPGAIGITARIHGFEERK